MQQQNQAQKRDKNWLGALIREYRLKAGMTQLELSTALGYESMQFVSLFERGLSKVPLKVVGKLVVVLGLPEKKVTKGLIEDGITVITGSISDGKKSVI